MRTVEELRELMASEHGWRSPKEGDFGEVLCYHIHELSLSFKELAKHFDITLDELAEVIADHIRRL